MVKKRTRWVRKGAKKTKGYRKTGRTRMRKGESHTKPDKELVLRIPSNRRIPQPDRIYCTFKKEINMAFPVGLCAHLGGFSYANIWLNGLIDVCMGTTTPATPASLYGMFAANLVLGNMNGDVTGGYTSSQSLNGFNRWLAQPAVQPTGLFYSYLVHKARIKITMDNASSSDDGYLCIVPCVDLVTTSFNQLTGTQHSKTKKIWAFNPVDNHLSHEFKPSMMFGLSDRQYNDGAKGAGPLIAGGPGSTLTGQYNTNPANGCWWTVGFQTTDGAATQGVIGWNIVLEYDTECFDANETQVGN